MIEDAQQIGTDAEPGSMLAQLRAAVALQQEQRTIDIPVGGTLAHMLAIRYVPLGQVAYDRYMAKRRVQVIGSDGRATVEKISQTEIGMDLMAQACVAVLGQGQVLTDEHGPVKLDHRLAELLDMPRTEGLEVTARNVILMLFGGNAAAIDRHSDRLWEWMASPADEPGEQ